MYICMQEEYANVYVYKHGCAWLPLELPNILAFARPFTNVFTKRTLYKIVAYVALTHMNGVVK